MHVILPENLLGSEKTIWFRREDWVPWRTRQARKKWHQNKWWVDFRLAILGGEAAAVSSCPYTYIPSSNHFHLLLFFPFPFFSSGAYPSCTAMVRVTAPPLCRVIINKVFVSPSSFAGPFLIPSFLQTSVYQINPCRITSTSSQSLSPFPHPHLANRTLLVMLAGQSIGSCFVLFFSYACCQIQESQV